MLFREECLPQLLQVDTIHDEKLWIDDLDGMRYFFRGR